MGGSSCARRCGGGCSRTRECECTQTILGFTHVQKSPPAPPGSPVPVRDSGGPGEQRPATNSGHAGSHHRHWRDQEGDGDEVTPGQHGDVSDGVRECASEQARGWVSVL